MLTQKNNPHQSSRVITLLILGVGLLLCTLSFVLADAQFQRDMESRTQEMNSRNLNLALALEQNVNRSFAQADTILKLVKVEIEAGGKLDPKHFSLLSDFLKTGIFNQIAVADIKGDLVYSAAPLTVPINISNIEHFQVHQKTNSGNMIIASPFVNRVTGTSSLFLSRRLNDAGGRFSGIVSVGISPEYFSKAIEQLQPGTYDSFVLISTEGDFLARVPSTNSDEIRESFKTHLTLAKIKEGVSFDVYESPGTGDGIVRIGAFRRLSDYPAIVLVAISKKEAFRVVFLRGADYRRWYLDSG